MQTQKNEKEEARIIKTIKLNTYNGETTQWDGLTYRTIAAAVETDDGNTVQDELDAISGNASAALERADEAHNLAGNILGGHKIVNPEGDNLTQRAKLQISGEGFILTDNENSNTTELTFTVIPYIDTRIGDIETILDYINGEVI